jgi:drug/metabolite transporter (DMT)-like permease
MTGTGILCGTTLLIFSSVAGFSGVAAPVSSAVLSGVIAAVIGGVAQSLTVIAIKQLGDYGWKPRKILAHRFYLLAISTAIAARFGPGLSVHIQDQIVPLSITTLFGIVLPLWSLQKGVLLSDPFTVSALIATGPVLTYVLEGFDNRINWSITSAAGCILVALFTLYASMNKAGKIK